MLKTIPPKGEGLKPGNWKLKTINNAENFEGAQLSEKDITTLKSIGEKIEELDAQEIKISFFEEMYLKVIDFAKKTFHCSNSCDQKEALLKEISSRNPSELRSSFENVIQTNLSPQINDALDCACKQYYSQPYKDSHIRPRETKWHLDGQIIHRYNHGIANTTRKVFMTPFVIDLFLRQGSEHLSEQLRKLIEEEGEDKIVQKLQLAIAFAVTGRNSECGSGEDLSLYKSYLAQSSNAFLSYCNEKELVGEGKLFKNEEDVNRYAGYLQSQDHIPANLVSVRRGLSK